MMKNKSVMQHAFSMVPRVSKPRSVFNRSHGHKTTFDTDYLIPMYWASVLPGDTVNLKHSMLLRLLTTSIKPIMDNVYLDWFYFFVPYRLIWSNFLKFMGQQEGPSDSISYTIPQTTTPNVASGGVAVGSLYDYLGVPVGPLSGGGGTTGLAINAFPMRGYTRIWQEWFHDQNLQAQAVYAIGDGPDTYAGYVLKKRGKRHDYFTGALPFLQKGTEVTLPLGSSAPVIGSGAFQLGTGTDGVRNVMFTSGSSTLTFDGGNATATLAAQYGGGLITDLSAATAATMSALRSSIALQQFLENDARGGTRYTEIVKQRFGVTSPDARLQRTELLSLGTTRISFNSVAQTTTPASSTKNDALGILGSYATGSDVGNGFFKSFTEHGIIIGLINVRADLNYQQGLDRHWFHRTRYDLYNPEFANLSEQPIYNKEIYANVPDGTSSSQKDGIFGYQERYAEYKYNKSLITGKLRSGVSGTLDIWHLAQEFTALPTLGSTFIEEAVPLDRCITVPSEPHFIIDAYYDEKWARVMPMFSVPGLNKL